VLPGPLLRIVPFFLMHACHQSKKLKCCIFPPQSTDCACQHSITTCLNRAEYPVLSNPRLFSLPPRARQRRPLLVHPFLYLKRSLFPSLFSMRTNPLPLQLLITVHLLRGPSLSELFPSPDFDSIISRKKWSETPFPLVVVFFHDFSPPRSGHSFPLSSSIFSPIYRYSCHRT